MAENRKTKATVRTDRFCVATLSVALALAAVGCKSDQQPAQGAPIVDGSAANDPAMANMADSNVAPGSMQPVAGQYAAQPAYTSSSAGQRVTPARTSAAPITRVEGQAYNVPNGQYGDGYANAPQYAQGTQQGYPNDPNAAAQDDQLYSELLDPNTPAAQQPPPPLPDYQQPAAPGPDYLWTPGYWDYANTGYYYVPGNWVSAPFVGALWTPGWWGYYGNSYRWHRGYWGPHVGFYGGVNYGFGFIGIGYQGGYWNNNHFYYNTYVNHVSPGLVNNYTYNRRVTVINNTYINNSRTSYFGGPGGLNRRPIPAEFAAVRETHLAPLPAQSFARQQAAQNRGQFFAENHGRPNMLYASNPVAERNVNVPSQLQHLQPNQAEFQQRIQAQQQRQQQTQQFRANEQQQRLQEDGQRQQQNQQFRANEQQQRLQADGQRQQQNQQFRGNEQQQNQAFRANEQQQRSQQQQQNQQFRGNEQQQNQAFRANEQQQRSQADQQRQQAQQQANQQRQQAVGQQRLQADQQRQQQVQAQQQQRAQADQQRVQQNQQRPAEVQQRPAEVQQRQVQPIQPRPQAQPQPHAAPAPAPHMEAPHAEAPHEGGRGR